MKKIAGIILLGFQTIVANGQSELEIVNATLSRSDFKAHINFIASDELRGRDTGSPEIDIAAKYLVTRLNAYGVKPIGESYFQEVKLKKSVAPSAIKLAWKDKNSEQLILLRGNNVAFEGKAVFLDYGTVEDFENTDVTGKLVIVKAGTGDDFAIRAAFTSSREKRKLAMEKGAAGVVELASIEMGMWGRLSNYFNREKIDLVNEKEDSFTHLWMLDTASIWSQKLKKGKSFKIGLIIEGMQNVPMAGKNVVGILEGTDPMLKNEYVMYSAHYDHIGVGQADAEGDSIYNGARDNAIGTVTVLSVAKNFGQYPTKRSALFVFFTGEEKGLLGSEWFADHSPIPMNQIVYCFNSDNAAYNDTSIATIFGLDKTTAKELIVQGVAAAGLKAMGDVAPEQNIYNRSDHVNFAKKGVPAILFGMGVKAFDEGITKTYHKQADNPETLDYEYLEKFFRAYMLTSRLIANAPEAPFWVEGDEYYEAGVKLYEKK